MRVDLHVHTSYSEDAFGPLFLIARMARLKKIDCLAVTDHNETKGAIKVRELSGTSPIIIVGEEIMTTGGEIIGLFLSERIEAGLTPIDAISRIKDQGGLVYLPHPFSGGKKRKGVFSPHILDELAKYIDIVEVLNARGIDKDASLRFAKKYNIVIAAGSDAHTPFEIGNAYMEMEPFDDPSDFLRKLKHGDVKGRFSPKWYEIISNRFVRKLLRALIK